MNYSSVERFIERKNTCAPLVWGHSLSLFLPTLQHMEFPGPWSNPSWSCDLCHSCNNIGSLTHCTKPGNETSVPAVAENAWSCCATVGTPVSLFLFFVCLFVCFFGFGLFVFCIFRAAPCSLYGGSQARGWIRATSADPHHSCSNPGSELRLQPTPQLKATLGPYPTEQGQGSNRCPHEC